MVIIRYADRVACLRCYRFLGWYAWKEVLLFIYTWLAEDSSCIVLLMALLGSHINFITRNIIMSTCFNLSLHFIKARYL